MRLKPWGNRSEATKAQSDRMTRLHQAMAPFMKSVAGYKRLQSLLPAIVPIRIGKSAKECAVSVSMMTDEKPRVVEALIRLLVNSSKPIVHKKCTESKAGLKAGVKKKITASTNSAKKMVNSMSIDEINRASPYKLKKLKNGDYAIMLGAIQYLRFDGVVWATYYCEQLNKGYREILRDLKDEKRQ